MLRILIIAGGFLAITAGLLVFQPGMGQAPRQASSLADEPAAPVSQVQVSRAETGLDLTSTGPIAADPLGSAVTLSTRPATAPADALQNLTASVLAGLGSPSAAPPATDTGDLRSMTSGVLAALGAATGPAPGATGPQKLETLIVQALRQGQSDAYLDALLNEAAATGAVTIPAALVTSDGRVDTVTLLASLVQKSAGQGGVDTAALAAAAGARPAPRPQRSTQDQLYVVQPGDSLAAISYRFYGETTFYQQIFAANRDLLTSPDKIRIGQKITIPAL